MHKFKLEVKNEIRLLPWSVYSASTAVLLILKPHFSPMPSTAFTMTPKKIILTLWHWSCICNALHDADDTKRRVLPTANQGPSYAYGEHLINRGTIMQNCTNSKPKPCVQWNTKDVTQSMALPFPGTSTLLDTSVAFTGHEMSLKEHLNVLHNQQCTAGKALSASVGVRISVTLHCNHVP